MVKGEKTYKEVLVLLSKYVHDHNPELRPSKVRNMVLEQVCALEQPFTAEQLVEACKAERISVGTVYNALNIFVDANILHATKRQRGLIATEYEIVTGTGNQFRMVCRKCGREVNLSDPAIFRMINERKYSNFNLQHFSLIVYGECKICRRKAIKKQLLG